MDEKIEDYACHIKKHYPKAIFDVWNTLYLHKDEITAIHPSKPSNGRLESAISEDKVINILKKYLKNITVPSSSRYWYDFLYKGFPINIKITTGKSADNAFNKQALIHSFTTHPITSAPRNFTDFHSKITNNLKIERDHKEYYYLVIFKDARNPLIKSLLDVQTPKSNPSNILQINWGKEYENRYYYEKEILEAYSRVLLTIQKSLKDKHRDEIKMLSENFTNLSLLKN
jgi:hypothetical protein